VKWFVETGDPDLKESATFYLAQVQHWLGNRWRWPGSRHAHLHFQRSPDFHGRVV
jgi:hypothetical protein